MERRQENNKYQVNFVSLKPPFSFRCSQFDDSVKFSLLKLFSVPPEFFFFVIFANSHVSFDFGKKWTWYDNAGRAGSVKTEEKTKRNVQLFRFNFSLILSLCVLLNLSHFTFLLLDGEATPTNRDCQSFWTFERFDATLRTHFRHSVNHFTWSAEKRFCSLVG